MVWKFVSSSIVVLTMVVEVGSLHASLWVTFTVTTCEEVSMALVVLTYGGVLLSASSAVARRVGLSFALS